MPTANSVNSKPKAAPLSMGMLPVDPKKFQVKSVAHKPADKSKSISFTKTASPWVSTSQSSTPSQATNGHRAAHLSKASPSPAAAQLRKQHRDASRSGRSSGSKRSSPAVRTPTTPMFDDDDDEEEEEESDADGVTVAKKRKLDTDSHLDTSRILFGEDAYTADAPHILGAMIHAADIAHEGVIEKAHGKFSHLFQDQVADGELMKHAVELQYPSLYKPERYNLVVPKEGDDLKPVDEILRNMSTVADNYLSENDACFLTDESNGLIRKIRRAVQKDDLSDFHDHVKTYNSFLLNSVQSGSIKSILSAKGSPLPLPWVERILDQACSRTVSLGVKGLRDYENGTDNVYGELLPRFVSSIFRETRLNSSQVFVDLGSGVGNVVLQAALEIGCEAWGCEMMEKPSKLAFQQQEEFLSRCQLWGLKPGPTHLEHGDFLTNGPTLSVLKKADVVLVNNQAFTPSLNDKLIMHFLDLKEGCQIVSLKSFVPQGHKITARNVGSPVNLLRDRELRFWSSCVSWTDAGGTWHVARKDGRMLEKWMEREGLK